MARFKEQKRSVIEKNERAMSEANMQCERRASEAQSVKSMIDNILSESRDEETREQVQMMEQQYRNSFQEAHRSEVEAPISYAKENLEQNKSDIADERTRTERSVSRIGDMRGVTDVGRSEARSAESNLQRSADEFRNMESVTENIEAEQESRAQNTLNRINSIFG
jgi:hypothetical protein